MKEFIEKLNGRLEKVSIPIFDEDTEMESKVIFTDIAKNIVNQLAEEYKDAEEQGLLLKLPCKIGDVFFSTITNGSADKCKVSSITIKSDETFKIRLSSGYYRSVFEVTTDDIGKTVFLTKEEAEQTLKQMGE